MIKEEVSKNKKIKPIMMAEGQKNRLKELNSGNKLARRRSIVVSCFFPHYITWNPGKIWKKASNKALREMKVGRKEGGGEDDCAVDRKGRRN